MILLLAAVIGTAVLVTRPSATHGAGPVEPGSTLKLRLVCPSQATIVKLAVGKHSVRSASKLPLPQQLEDLYQMVRPAGSDCALTVSLSSPSHVHPLTFHLTTVKNGS
jgi:hypothetical protein